MKRIKSNYHILQVLKKATPKVRNVILKSANKELILAIIECALNVLNGQCKLPSCSRRKLFKHKNTLRHLVDRKVSLSKKKKTLVQKGGFLIPLLSSVLSVLGSLT